MRARSASAILGAWLFLSVFFWHHPAARGFNDLAVGALLFVSGCCGQYFRSLRYFDGLLGIWLVVCFFVLHANTLAARAHDGVLGLFVIALATRGGQPGEKKLDHWVRVFDRNPAIMRRPFDEE